MELHQQQPNAGHGRLRALKQRTRPRSQSAEMLGEARVEIRQGVDTAHRRRRKLGERIRLKEQERTQLIGSPAKQAEALDRRSELLNEYQSVQVRTAQSVRATQHDATAAIDGEEIKQELDSHTILLEFALGSEAGCGS
jgi:hypothetical protein